MDSQTQTWMKEEGALDATAVAEGMLARRVHRSGSARGPGAAVQNLAIFLKPLVVLATRKWFGDADLRLDALVVHGGGDAALFHPHTFRFPRVADGDDLAGTENGLLIYLGKPEHFLSLSLMLARDTKDSDDLATLIQAGAASAELASATSALAGMALPSVEIAAVQAGVKAALELGELAYKLVRAVSPSCLGLYRASWLAEKDKFGIGRHPRSGAHRVKDFDVGYTIERG
jgi:hypothetical protein